MREVDQRGTGQPEELFLELVIVSSTKYHGAPAADVV